MKVRRVQIEQQRAQLQIESQKAALSIQMPIRRMKVERKPAQMTVETTPGSVKLDMQSFRNKMGIKSVFTLADETANQAMADVKEAIAGIVSDGDYVGTIPSNVNAIAELSRSKMLNVQEPTLYHGNVPDGTIKMEGVPGDVKINWSRHEVKISWDEYQAPVITVEPKASVNVQMAQEPNVEITVVEMSIPPETGGTVDAEA